MVLGAQFYTIHEFTKTLDDFAESLKKVADIGYREVQISATCGYTGEWLDEQLKKNGLTCHLTHFNYGRTVNETDDVIALHKAFGCKYIGLGSMPGWDTGYDKFVSDQNLRAAIKKINAAGMRYTYHNHDFEFETIMEDGECLLHHLAQAFTPEELSFTLDTYWALFAGADVEQEVKYLRGRLGCVHFKDMRIDDKGERFMSWCGGGNTFDFEKLLPAFEEAGTEYVYVEQDSCYDEDPFVCLKRSYDYLSSIGLK